jgi:hypothetical protein
LPVAHLLQHTIIFVTRKTFLQVKTSGKMRPAELDLKNLYRPGTAVIFVYTPQPLSSAKMYAILKCDESTRDRQRMSRPSANCKKDLYAEKHIDLQGKIVLTD